MIRQIYQGRTGNLLLQLVGMSILSEKLNYRVYNYIDTSMFKSIGFKVFENGEKTNNQMVLVNDDSLIRILEDKNQFDFGIVYDGTYQVKDFVLNYRDKIKSHFYPVFNKNENLFVHVRLGDVCHLNPGLEYYKRSISKCEFTKGYISSDTPDHPIISELVKEFSLEVCNIENMPSLINFARQSKYLVLSRGTLSWWMGVLSNADKIFVPGKKDCPNNNLDFTGNIFVFDDWIYDG